jgi:hypothetical protein
LIGVVVATATLPYKINISPHGHPLDLKPFPMLLFRAVRSNFLSLITQGTYSGFDTEHKLPVEIYSKALNQRTQILHALFGEKINVHRFWRHPDFLQ